MQQSLCSRHRYFLTDDNFLVFDDIFNFFKTTLDDGSRWVEMKDWKHL